MKLLSVNVGRPQAFEWSGKPVRTSIVKHPVAGPVQVRTLNLDGDEQSDLSVHGGTEKAVYVYPSEHYPYWREQFPAMDIPWGAFGENLTTEGLTEAVVSIGDHLRIGSAEFLVTQPRLPCYKLAGRFGRLDMVKRFLQSGRSGFYLSVLRPGLISAGDAIEWRAAEQPGVSVTDVVRLYTEDRFDADLLRRAIQLAALPLNWRETFRERLARASPGAR